MRLTTLLTEENCKKVINIISKLMVTFQNINQLQINILVTGIRKINCIVDF